MTLISAVGTTIVTKSSASMLISEVSIVRSIRTPWKYFITSNKEGELKVSLNATLRCSEMNASNASLQMFNFRTVRYGIWGKPLRLYIAFQTDHFKLENAVESTFSLLPAVTKAYITVCIQMKCSINEREYLALGHIHTQFVCNKVCLIKFTNLCVMGSKQFFGDRRQ